MTSETSSMPRALPLGALALVLGVLVAGCPAPRVGCARNSDCAAGSYCSAGACVTDCTPATVAADCDPGQMCSSFGMCVGGADAGPGIDAGPDAAVADGGLDAGAPLDAPAELDTGPPADDVGADAGTMPTDAGADAGPTDAGRADTGSPSDAGPRAGTLVLNEIDYDQPSTDNAEFLEIYNAGASAADLTGLAVVFVNGSTSAEYARASLSGTLATGAFLVVGVAGQPLTLPGGVVRVDISVGIQNGAPDGVALWDTTRLVLVDALSYEGSITAAVIDATTVSLVEGTPSALAESNTTPDSLCRRPDGRDTNDAASDWMVCTTPTPGGPN